MPSPASHPAPGAAAGGAGSVVVPSGAGACGATRAQQPVIRGSGG
ncbi:hypothetical protein [Kocuria sp. U4B]|jgi:hypothetical protein|nr:hypothetical protein [Kocuria rosea]